MSTTRRLGHSDLLERLLVDGYAALLEAARLERVAQDGLRARGGRRRLVPPARDDMAFVLNIGRPCRRRHAIVEVLPEAVWQRCLAELV